LSGARNSKIIGLSGTPLINFPEEIAILANLIGGYIHTCFLKVTPSDQFKVVRDILQKNLYVDFEEVDTLGGNIQILFTSLPEGMVKATTESGNLGVQRVPPGTTTPSIQEVATDIIKQITDLGMRVVEGPTYKSEPLLPPIGEEFRENFLNGLDLKNTIVLRKRLQGLVSYYRGSKKELMPAVTRDEVVFVPFSEFARREYERVRGEEITIQKEQKQKSEGPALQGVGKMGNLWAEIYDLAKMKQSNSYRMSSRQACNFAMPGGIPRPRPRDVKDLAVDLGEEKEEVIAAADAEGAEDLLNEDEEKAADASEEEGEADDAAGAAAEDAALDTAERKDLLEEGVTAAEADGLLGEEVAPVIMATGGSLKATEEFVLEGVDELEGGAEGEAAPGAGAPLAPGAPPAKKSISATNILKKAKETCKASILSSPTYMKATERAKYCLKTYESKQLLLFPPGQELAKAVREKLEPDPQRLTKYSPKYAKILYNIIDSPGSSLVYSQFLDMEGIGIFSIALEANAFHSIEIMNDESGNMKFSDKTIEHLKLGPGYNRFLTFTGDRTTGAFRIMALKVFNARYENGNFVELPPQMSKVLIDAGFTGNSDGGLCRTFCITSAGAEGLSLKNVRRVHIMEPFWNHVRTDQVKGRAVRICSHIDLDLAERNVEVFTYCAVFDDGLTGEAPHIDSEFIRSNDGVKPEEAAAMGFKVRPGTKDYILTSDQHLYQLSERKKKVLHNSGQCADSLEDVNQ
jgi:hypothetical protein